MSFHVADTPTLQAVATEDEHLLTQDLQARVEEAAGQAEAQPEVVEATEAHRVAQERLERLRIAERALNKFAKQSREHLNDLSQAALDALVESAAAGKLEFKKLSEQVTVENQIRAMTRAIEKLTEHRLPLALIAGLREEAHALQSRARAMERIAQERAEKVLGQLRDAVTEEVVLPVDMSKGVVGALLSRAAAYKRSAVQVSESADRIEREYQDRYGC
jgi:hypothetical protein